jgi:hypothetical protein
MVLTAACFAGVAVSSPINGSTVTSPTHFVASAFSSYPITSMRIYVDSVSKYATSTNKIDTYLSLSAGTHSVVVQAWDSTGAVFKAPETINVSSTTTSNYGVTVTSPTNGATVNSPVHFTASARSSYPITAMRIYVDGTSVYAVNAASLDTYVNIGGGTHNVVVQAWDQAGKVFKSLLTLTVASSGGGTAPSGAKTYSQIEQMSGWENCTVCAGIGANGPVAKYSMTQGFGNPSMDGNSAQFWIGGSTPYSDALWWKQLGGNSAPTHFVYDLYFYIKTPQVAQALEFDVNHSVGGKKYIMGVQCDVKTSHQWDVWDGAAKKWAPTGIACPAPPAYQWNHLVEEFYHDNTGKVTFVAITLNGVKHYVNRTYWSQSSGVSEVNVAFQMDGDYKQTPYSTWLDQVKLTYW